MGDPFISIRNKLIEEDEDKQKKTKFAKIESLSKIQELDMDIINLLNLPTYCMKGISLD